MPLIVTMARLPLSGSVLALALAATFVLPAAADEPPGGYPSWAEVQAAEDSESAKAAEIATITGLLSSLEAESEAAGDAAVRSAAGYAAADAALQASAARVDTLSVRAAHANAELTRYRKDLGALAVQSYKTGGTNTGFFVALDALESNSVQGLNLVKLAGDKTATLVTNAAAAEKAATAFAEQEKLARSERERLSGEAGARLEAASSARDGLARQVAEEQRKGTELTAQLATLKGTTAALEGEYRQGQAAQAAYVAAQAAKRAAAEEQARREADAAATAAAAAAQQPNAAPARPVGPAPANPVQPNPVPPRP
ncbi:lytic transglycosylase domain-containing protein, partial [Pseudarthrobacter sp. C4D7]|uniref:lytic transglycosylase domain-containing protein n=1 Tax=Pseudarthrobacter sp. C4D7 TaxID=2735268 RepID=UPI00158466C5